MKSFELSIGADWVEVLGGGSLLAFDVISSERPEIYFTETAATPANVTGAPVATFPAGWDFHGSGFASERQRIWLRGTSTIRGVRA